MKGVPCSPCHQTILEDGKTIIIKLYDNEKDLMTLVAVLCCAMTMTVLTSCTKDKDKFVYTIKAEPGGLMNGIEAGNWRNSVMSVYQAALDTDKKWRFSCCYRNQFVFFSFGEVSLT